MIIADLDDAQNIADADSPSSDWEGDSFKGRLDNLKFGALLSILRSGSPQHMWDNCPGHVPPRSKNRQSAFPFSSEQLARLVEISAMDEDALHAVADVWEVELDGADFPDVFDVLRRVGNLAEEASLRGKCLMLWISY